MSAFLGTVLGLMTPSTGDLGANQSVLIWSDDRGQVTELTVCTNTWDFNV